MIPVIKEENTAYWIDESDLIQFISKNQTEMGWNQICDFIRNFINDTGNTYFEKNNKELPFWVDEFFKAHPFLSKIYFVFND